MLKIIGTTGGRNRAISYQIQHLQENHLTWSCLHQTLQALYILVMPWHAQCKMFWHGGKYWYHSTYFLDIYISLLVYYEEVVAATIETLVNIFQTVWYHITEDIMLRTLISRMFWTVHVCSMWDFEVFILVIIKIMCRQVVTLCSLLPVF